MAQALKQKIVNFRTTEKAYEHMKDFAAFNGQTMSEMIADSVWRRIEDWEDLMAIEEYKKERAAGKVETVSWEQVKKDAGL
jgi:predicted DNA-binding protein